MKPFFTAFVKKWNYHIGLEDSSVMKGQPHWIEELGAPHVNLVGLGDDLVSKYWKWRNEAHENLSKDSDGKIKSLYFSSYVNDGSPISIAMGTSIFGDQSETAILAPTAVQMATTTPKVLDLTLSRESPAL
jgi:hypothetical protein